MDTSVWYDAKEVAEFNPDAFDLYWNADYSKFRAVPLRWTDDASYAAYQAGSDREDDLGPDA